MKIRHFSFSVRVLPLGLALLGSFALLDGFVLSGFHPTLAQQAPQAQTFTPEAPIVAGQDGKAERPMPAPFTLTQEEQVQTDAVLKRWEQFSTSIKTFESPFSRIMYVVSFEHAGQLDKVVETGEIRYESPDRGMFAVNNDKGEPSEKWLCDGKTVYEYKFKQKQIDQHVLPPEMQGKGITNGPLPFLFGASADELKRRYYIRHVTPPQNQQRPGEIWLEAFPKTSEDAADFPDCCKQYSKALLSLQKAKASPPLTQNAFFDQYDTRFQDKKITDEDEFDAFLQSLWPVTPADESPEW